MKNKISPIAFLVLIALLSTEAFSQNNIPNLLHFTAVARDSNDNPITNTVYVKIEIFQGQPSTSNTLYCEQAPATPNMFGEFSINFPNSSGLLLCPPNFSLHTVDWDTGDKWVRISFQPTGNASNPFQQIASFPFTTVPFAFASRTAESITNFDLTGAGNGDVIKFNSSTGKWEAGDDETSVFNVPAGGDLTGNYPNPLIGNGKVQSSHIANGAILSEDLSTMGANIPGQVLKWNGSSWEAGTDELSSGTVDVNITGTGINVNESPANNFNLSIGQGAINGSQIADGTITAIDIANGVIPTIPQSLPPSGSAGGQLAGIYPNPQIASMGAMPGQTLRYSGSAWVPSDALITDFGVQTTNIMSDYRGDTPIDIPSTHVTVPADGTYLILANLAVSNMRPGDATLNGHIVRLNNSPQTLFIFEVVTRINNVGTSQNQFGESSSWNVATLNAGDIITLQFTMSQWFPETNPYTVRSGRIFLVKL